MNIKKLFPILILSLLIRLLFLNHHPPWFDELASIKMASVDLSKMFYLTAQDTHPPLYFLLLKLWSSISREVLYLRFLSLIFGVVTIPIAYKLTKLLTNSKIAIWSTLIISLSPLHIYFSSEIRMYSLFVLLTMLVTLTFLLFINYKKITYLFSLILFQILNLYTHYYAVIWLIAINIIFFMFLKKHRSLATKWIFAQIIILFNFLPWIIFVLNKPHLDCWCFHPLIGLPTTFLSWAVGGLGIITINDIMIYGPKIVWIFFIFSGLLIFLFFIMGFLHLWKKQNIKIVGIFAIPLIVVFISGFVYDFFSPRSLIIISPFYYIMVSSGIYTINNIGVQKLVIRTILSLLILINFIQLAHPFFSYPVKPKENYIFDQLEI